MWLPSSIGRETSNRHSHMHLHVCTVGLFVCLSVCLCVCMYLAGKKRDQHKKTPGPSAKLLFSCGGSPQHGRRAPLCRPSSRIRVFWVYELHSPASRIVIFIISNVEIPRGYGYWNCSCDATCLCNPAVQMMLVSWGNASLSFALLTPLIEVCLELYSRSL